MLIKLPKKTFVDFLSSLSNWKNPMCPNCNSELTPWFDWGYYSKLSYCPYCEVFAIVNSKWKPSDKVHPKAEIDELVKHTVTNIEINKVYFRKLILYHTNNSDDLYNLNATRLKLTLLYTEESIFLQHLIWFLLFRNNHFYRNELIVEFIWFRLQNSNTIAIQNSKFTLYEDFDLVKELNKNYKEVIIDTIYSIWKNSNEELIENIENIKPFIDYQFYTSKEFEKEFRILIKQYGNRYLT